MLDAPSTSFQTLEIAGVETSLDSRRETTDFYLECIRLKRNGRLSRPVLSTSMNGQTIYEALKDRTIATLFNRFDHVSMDGQPPVLLSRFWRHSFAERVATTDLIHDVASAGLVEGVRHFLFGAEPDIVKAAAAQLRAAHPGIAIVGVQHGYVTGDELERVAAKITKSRAEIVWVCMGVPREQDVTLKLAELAPNVAVFKTGGGVLDFVSGAKKRAPTWMQSVGLEWLFRLQLEPKRLLKRYAISSPIALLYLLSPAHALRNARSRDVATRAAAALSA